jgi:hypothetical protein
LASSTFLLGLGLLLAPACGGPNLGGVMPSAQSAQDTQSRAMATTTAGQNKCGAKNHNRPFVIEWDATDTSGFEARAKTDVIFVRYDGCELRVLEGCVNDSMRGAFGSYRQVEWTSGSVEVLEIANETELNAKLPLGVATLGGRVQGGEKFRMEYFVAGTRSATRDKVYRDDLASIASCKEATHFVYGYNLGAFALGSANHLDGEVEGSVFGGPSLGAKHSKKVKAEKTGGLLSSCRGSSAKEADSCKTPIRVTLREIDEGTNPDQKAMLAPETPTAKNLAGKLKIESDREKRAQEHADQARQKLVARDGKGCLAELDLHDKLDPRPIGLSTNPKAILAMQRGQCAMLAGHCDAGKQLYRRAIEASGAMQVSSPELLDKSTDFTASQYCQGSSVSGRDRIAKATMDLSQGAYTGKRDAAFCNAAIDTLKSLLPVTPPKDEDDNTITEAPDSLNITGPACLAKAGDCEGAFKLFQELGSHPEYYRYARASRRSLMEQNLAMRKGAGARGMFTGVLPGGACKGP